MATVDRKPNRAELLQEGECLLIGKSTSPRLDAEILLAFVEKIERYSLIVDRNTCVDARNVDSYRALLERRANSEPIAYLVGKREFYGRDFKVTSEVLIPRPESELIVDTAILLTANYSKVEPIAFLDLGTGSGCLACSICAELLQRKYKVSGVAVDISRGALHVAEQNARNLGVGASLTFIHGSWFDASLVERLVGSLRFDLIVANPPYVTRVEYVSPETAYEPCLALYSEESGLRDVKQILVTSPQLLAPGGDLLIEVGAHKRQLCLDLIETELGHSDTWASASLLGDTSLEDRFTVMHFKKTGLGARV